MPDTFGGIHKHSNFGNALNSIQFFSFFSKKNLNFGLRKELDGTHPETEIPWPVTRPVTRGPVVDSVDETFLGSQVRLDALKDYPFMHWIPGAEPATAGVRVLARL